MKSPKAPQKTSTGDSPGAVEKNSERAGDDEVRNILTNQVSLRVEDCRNFCRVSWFASNTVESA